MQLRQGLSGGKNMIFSAVILPGIRKIFNMVRQKHNIAVASYLDGIGLTVGRENKESKWLVGRTFFTSSPIPFNLHVERLA